jgi:hypothetical protein
MKPHKRRLRFRVTYCISFQCQSVSWSVRQSVREKEMEEEVRDRVFYEEEESSPLACCLTFALCLTCIDHLKDICRCCVPNSSVSVVSSVLPQLAPQQGTPPGAK